MKAEDEWTYETRPWRTQVHFRYVDTHGVMVELPSWHLDWLKYIPWSQLPEDLKNVVHRGYRCHAQVNIGAQTLTDLRFSDWELS